MALIKRLSRNALLKGHVQVTIHDRQHLRGTVVKITRIELHLIRVPFDMGAAPTAFAGMNLTSVDSLFVRVCTDAGVDGWGEGWGTSPARPPARP